MNQELLDHLSEATLAVLKASAFAWGEPCPTVELPAVGGEAIVTRVRFQGDATGNVCLAMPAEVAAALAADILSAEADELSDEQIDDACKELTNVVCGQWLTRSFGDRPVFHLSVPEAEHVEKAEWYALIDGPGAVGVQIDERPLAAGIHLD